MKPGIDNKICKNAKCQYYFTSSLQSITGAICSFINPGCRDAGMNHIGCHVPDSCLNKNLHLLSDIKNKCKYNKCTHVKEKR